MDIYRSEFDEVIDSINDIYDSVDEETRHTIMQHDAIIEFLALRDVMHLLDLIELGDREKLEFRKLTKKGEIEIEASANTMNRIRKHIVGQMARIGMDICRRADER